MTCLKCQHGIAKRFGTYGRKGVQRYRCRTCSATFSVRPANPLGNHTLDLSKAVQVISLLTEGMSVRAISRVTGVHKTTILSLLATVGGKCRRIFDRYVRDVKPRFIQADELWAYVHTKEGHLMPGDSNEWGDAYTWIAMDSETKLILSYYIGQRDAASAFEFVRDLSERIATGRFQITTDGLRAYVDAIEQYFGASVDFAQLLKVYGKVTGEGPDWYAPTKVVDIVPVPISGNPKPERISTSHIERANLSVRMHLRRFTRLTNGFSKKLENLKLTVALYMTWFNFCRVHQTLRVTPAMEAGLTDHIWSVEELIRAVC
jgi:IS1 family transposase/transposase-like protein